MWVTDDISDALDRIAGYFRTMADAVDAVPLLGKPLASPFRSIASRFDSISSRFWWVGYYLQTCWDKVWTILSWSDIRSNIRGTWTWIDHIDDRIWSTARSKIRSTWTWIDSIDDRIWSTARSKIRSTWTWIDHIDDRIWSTARSNIRGTWTWIDSIDDRIRSTARAQWTWIDHIDDRIKTVAWDYVTSRLGDWLISWLLLNLTIWGRIGYRILDRIWSMEWDDSRKEVR